MSYKAFKRLLGETSLERKCRWLLGAGVLVLMTGSFWVYARQTEDLAYEQLESTGRALLPSIVARLHVRADLVQVVDDFQRSAEDHWPSTLKDYKFDVLRPDAQDEQHRPTAVDQPAMHAFADATRNELTRRVPKENAYYYYGALRAAPACVACHRDEEKMGPGKANPDLKPDDLM